MHFPRSAARLTAGLLLVSALVTPSLAATGTVNAGGSTLRMRAESNTGSTILKSLDHGTQVEVLTAVENGWYQIAHEGTTGYVSGDYLTVDAAEAAALPVEELPTYVQITTSALNVRSGPGTDYEKVDSLAAGQVVKGVLLDSGWYQIDQGYISADYAAEVDLSSSAAHISAEYAQEIDPSQMGQGQAIADFALQFVGYPYVYGGSSPSGFDCSGFTSYVYKQFGYSINRTASNQLDNGYAVDRANLQPGDLVMFCQYGSTKRASHVGLYIGNNQYVHASTPGVGVIISDMDDMSISSGYVGARRIV